VDKSSYDCFCGFLLALPAQAAIICRNISLRLDFRGHEKFGYAQEDAFNFVFVLFFGLYGGEFVCP
jgi:hypothetical protein